MDEKVIRTSWLRDLLDLIDNYGVFRIIKATILMGFITLVSYFIFNPSMFFERYSEYEKQKHSESFEYRMKSTPIVQELIDKLILESGGMRAFIVELHNGKYNSAGLSFNYGSLTYEGLRDSTESIREDYSDFSLERFPMVMKIYNDGYWEGTIDDMQSIDKRLSLRLESNGAYYVAFTTIYGTKENIGFLGITFNKNDKFNKNEIKKLLMRYSSKVSPLLDGENIK